jgi:hypothetical protein
MEAPSKNVLQSISIGDLIVFLWKLIIAAILVGFVLAVPAYLIYFAVQVHVVRGAETPPPTIILPAEAPAAASSPAKAAPARKPKEQKESSACKDQRGYYDCETGRVLP